MLSAPRTAGGLGSDAAGDQAERRRGWPGHRLQGGHGERGENRNFHTDNFAILTPARRAWVSSTRQALVPRLAAALESLNSILHYLRTQIGSRRLTSSTIDVSVRLIQLCTIQNLRGAHYVVGRALLCSSRLSVKRRRPRPAVRDEGASMLVRLFRHNVCQLPQFEGASMGGKEGQGTYLPGGKQRRRSKFTPVRLFVDNPRCVSSYCEGRGCQHGRQGEAERLPGGEERR